MSSKKTFSIQDIPDNSNGAVLRPWELLLTAIVVLTLCWLVLPCLFFYKEKLTMPEKDYRLSYNYRDDYLLYQAAAKEVCRKYPSIFIGDSVIWGMYVENAHTLPAILNQKRGKEEFGNLAIDGLHPVAMETLICKYGKAITGKKVYLYWNPLWMNTPLYDLSGKGEMTVNHPRLLPQFDYSIKSYRGSWKERCNTSLERLVPYYALLHHIRVTSFQNSDFKSHIAKHPGENPLTSLKCTIDPVEREHKDGDKDWKFGGGSQQNWPWVMPQASRQWAALLRVAALLQERSNEVTILLGTVNPYMQTKESLARYEALRKEVKTDLNAKKIRYIELAPLPSKEYADASHPLYSGYKRIAEDFLAKEKR